jgi:hypothetical protein
VKSRTIVLVLSLAACESSSKPPAAPASAPTAEKGPNWEAAFQHQARWDAARKAVVVDVTIAPGFHAYTTGETVGKPLLVEISPDSELALEGDVVYPAGVPKDLPIGRSVIVEGKAEIVAKVTPKSEGADDAKGTLRYQVCTEQACDRPRTAAFAVKAQ